MIIEFKAWLGEASAPASRTLAHGAWLHSSRYAVRSTVDDGGVARAWLTLLPQPGTTLDALIRAGIAPIGVRARAEGGDAGRVHEIHAQFLAGDVALADVDGAAAIAVGDARAPLALVTAADARIPGYALVPAGEPVWRMDADGGIIGRANVTAAPDLAFVRALPRSAGRGEPHEFVEVLNAHVDAGLPLAGICFESGSARGCFVAGEIAPGATVAFARDPVALERAGGPSGARPFPTGFTVADSDTVRATWLGRALDAWEFSAPATDVILTRAGSVAGIGWSSMLPTADPEARVTPLVAPIHLLDALERVTASASRAIDAAFYSVHSEDAAAAFARAALAGIRVRILIEGSPVGGLDADARALLDGLTLAGVEVFVMDARAGEGRRYAAMHAKYVVADESVALLLTENASPGSFRASGDGGTRGFGALIESVVVGEALTRVFEDDANASRPDVRAWTTSAAARLPLAAPRVRAPAAEAVTAGVVIALAPDDILGVEGPLGVIAAAERELLFAGLYLHPRFRDEPSPFVEALFEAAARGVDVRVLLAASDDNAEVIDLLNARAHALDVSLEARVFDAPPLSRLHAKAIFADGRAAWVGSLNWGEVSATQNREVGFRVDSAAVVDVWRAAFVHDWDGGAGPDAPRAWTPPLALPAPAPAASALVLVAAAWLVRRARTR